MPGLPAKIPTRRNGKKKKEKKFYSCKKGGTIHSRNDLYWLWKNLYDKERVSRNFIILTLITYTYDDLIRRQHFRIMLRVNFWYFFSYHVLFFFFFCTCNCISAYICNYYTTPIRVTLLKNNATKKRKNRPGNHLSRHLFALLPFSVSLSRSKNSYFISIYSGGDIPAGRGTIFQVLSHRGHSN